MKTWEMIKAMSENPKRKAKNCKTGSILQWIGGTLKWNNDDDVGFVEFLITTYTSSSDWEIIEPELEQVDFATAYKAYKIGKTIKSCVNNHLFSAVYDRCDTKYICNTTYDEIDGKWIILED